MDRHQVRIKINGQEKSFSKGKKQRKPSLRKERVMAPINTEVPENNTFPEEDIPLIIVDEMAAAAEKKEEEDFEWVLPKEPTKEEISKKNAYIEDLRHLKQEKIKKTPATPFGKKKVKLAPPSFSKQLTLSIVMAIGVGTCLGFIILGIMKMSTNDLNPALPVTTPVLQGTSDTTDSTEATGTLSVTIPQQTVAVLQGGALSTSEAANTEVQKLQAQGFAASTVSSDPVFVLIAVGQSVEGMKVIGGLALNKGFETYAKELVIPEKTFSDLTEGDVALLQDGQGLYKDLVSASSVLLQGGALAPGLAEKLEQEFTKVSGMKEEGLSESTKQWKAWLTGAHADIQEYQSSKSTAKLWDAQQKLLQATGFLY